MVAGKLPVRLFRSAIRPPSLLASRTARRPEPHALLASMPTAQSVPTAFQITIFFMVHAVRAGRLASYA